MMNGLSLLTDTRLLSQQEFLGIKANLSPNNIDFNITGNKFIKLFV